MPRKITSRNTIKAGIHGDLGATGPIDLHLSLPKPGEKDDRDSFFNHEFRSKVAFAQDWFQEEMKNVQCGRETSIELPKAVDILRHEYVVTKLPGIIGVQSLTTASHMYPHLVSENDCKLDTSYNCVPIQERLFRDFSSDPVLGGPNVTAAKLQQLKDDVDPNKTGSKAKLAKEASENVTTARDELNNVADSTTSAGDAALADKVVALHNANVALAEKNADLAAAQAAYDAALAHPVGALTSRPFVHWVNGAGYRLIEEFTLHVGQNPLDSFDYRYIHAIDSLHRQAAKGHARRAGMYDSREELIRASLYEQELFVELPLWYTHYVGISLFQVKQQLTENVMTIKVAELNKLVVCSDPKTHPHLSAYDGTDWAYNTGDASPHDRVATDTKLSAANAVTSMHILHNAYYLEEAERDVQLFRASRTHERNAEKQVITKCQWLEEESQGNVSESFDLPLHEAIFELIVIAQLASNKHANDFFNYSRIGPDVGSTGATTYTVDDTGKVTLGEFPHEVRIDTIDADIISEINVYQNDNDRFYGNAKVWRGIVPAEVHTSVANHLAGHYIYAISWAVFPEDVGTYSGSVNATRIQTVSMTITFTPRAVAEKKHINIYARTFGLYTQFGNIGGGVYSG